jgi:hypothetical protein
MLPVLWRTKARSSRALITGYIAERNPIAAQRLKDATQSWSAKCQWLQNSDLLGIEYPSRKLMFITYNNVPFADCHWLVIERLVSAVQQPVASKIV